jgi:proteic killer suppression protein
MIVSFGDEATEDFFNGTSSKAARQWTSFASVALRKLDMVNAAARLEDLKVSPGNRLEALKGDLAGKHGIRINQQWRIVFRWEDGAGAHEVQIVDYH